MAIHKISDHYISHINMKRALFVAGLVVFIMVGYDIWDDGATSVSAVATAIAVAAIVAIGRSKYQWAVDLVEEAQWTIEPVEGALAFHFKGGCARIAGGDIEKITAKFKERRLLWFDVHYGKQVTRLQSYDNMDRLYAHTRKIAGKGVQIEEIH